MTDNTITLQVVSTDHFAEISRAKVRGRALEVARVWITLSDGVNCAKCHIFPQADTELGRPYLDYGMVVTSGSRASPQRPRQHVLRRDRVRPRARLGRVRAGGAAV